MKKRKTSFKAKPVILLAAAAILLIASTVGATQAAKLVYSADYRTEVEVKNIGVSLLENGEVIGETGQTAEGTLFGKLNEELEQQDERFVVGKAYDEVLSVKNSGTIDAYVRVIIRKSWIDADGNADRKLSPEYIDLKLTESADWKKDETASTEERTVLYYTKKLAVGETVEFASSIKLDNAFETTLDQTVTEVSDGKKITYAHPFDGYTFNVEVEVDAVQTNSAAAAIKSAWGVDADVSETDGSLAFN